MNYLTRQNDLYLFFEVTRQIKAKSILDIGMTLKRAGAISRQIADSRIPRNVMLIGIDPFEELDLPVYHAIYDQILTVSEILSEKEHFPHVTLSTCLSLPELSSYQRELLPLLKTHSDYILADSKSGSFLFPFFPEKKARSIQNGKDTYFLLELSQ